jgi:hypothetical protein
LFTRESLLASDWYRERLRAKQCHDIALWTRHRNAMEKCAAVHAELKRVSSAAYLEELNGTIGADPFSIRP